MREKINTYRYYFKNLVSVLYSMVLNLFGVKLSTKEIPHGVYCYVADIEKNKNRTDKSTFYTIPCKYYKPVSKWYTGCSYLGYISDDIIFGDQCKVCCENDDTMYED
jgi:hypothetical protein